MRVFPEPVTVSDGVRPLNADVEVAMVIVAPVCVCPVGPIAVMADER